MSDLEKTGVRLVVENEDAFTRALDEANKSVKDFERSAGQSSGGINAFSELVIGGLRRIGEAAITAFGQAVGAVAGFVSDGITAASDLSESTNKVGVVFGDSADAVRVFARTAATQLGQSEQQALEAAGTYGNLLTSIGVMPGAAADMSTSLVTLASDLASFNNASPEETLLALRSALTGEFEPMKRFGAALSADAVAAKAMEMGLADSKKALTPAMKAQAAYALILEQTTNAQGDFARTSDGMANQQRTAAAQWKDLQAAVGAGFLPVAQLAFGIFTSQLAPALMSFAQNVLPGLVAGVTEFGTQAQVWLTGVAIPALTNLWTQAQPALQSLGSFITGTLLPAIAGAVSWIVANWPGIQAAIAAAWAGIQPVVQGMADVWMTNVLPIFQTVVNWVATNWPLIQTTIAGVMTIVSQVVQEVLAKIRTWWDEHGASVTTIVETFFSGIRSTVDTVLGVVKGIIEDVLPAIKAFWDTWGADIQAIVDGLFSVVGDIFDGFAKAFQGDWRGFGEELRSAWDTIWDGIKEIVNRAAEWFTNQDWGKIGRNIIEGIGNGITAATGFIVDAAQKAAEAALDALKGFLGISSPAKRPRKEVGQPIGEGIEMGILDKARSVSAAGGALARAAITPPLPGRYITSNATYNNQRYSTYQLNLATRETTASVQQNFYLLEAMSAGSA